jgi:flagellar biogenesis protein FliO
MDRFSAWIKGYARPLNNRSGQTLVEFIFLLAIIMTLSILFMKVVNQNLATYWQFFVTKIVNDPSIKLDI